MERTTNSLYPSIAPQFIHSADKQERKAARKMLRRPFNVMASNRESSAYHLNGASQAYRHAVAYVQRGGTAHYVRRTIIDALHVARIDRLAAKVDGFRLP